MRCWWICGIALACEPAKGLSDNPAASGGSAAESAEDDGGIDDGEGDGDDTGGSVADPPNLGGSISVVFPDGMVLDPKLAGAPALTLGISMDGDLASCSIDFQVANGIGQRAVWDTDTTEVTWDGTDSDGRYFDPGLARVRAKVDCGSVGSGTAEAMAWILRLGIAAVDFRSPDDAEGVVPLAFHKDSLFSTVETEIGDTPEYELGNSTAAILSDVDLDDGAPRAATPRWTQPDVSPWADGDPEAHNVPAAFVAASEIVAEVHFGATGASAARRVAVGAFGPQPDAAPPVRLKHAKFPARGSARIQPGASVVVDLDPAQATMGLEVRTIKWRFESQDTSGEWTVLPGSFTTEHDLYTLAGQPALLDGTEHGLASDTTWIGTLADLAGSLEGVAPEAAPVLDALRDYLFEHEYIIYDPSISAYTEFEGEYIYWESITADLSGFLDRRSGLRLYCHSMSCLLSTLAGSVGIEAEQLVLGVGFTTNLARAAGTDSWGSWGFNSHSVVSPDDAATIWDSSIALDGDDAPDVEPIEEIMPRGMPADEYFWRLTYDEIGIVNRGLCYRR